MFLRLFFFKSRDSDTIFRQLFNSASCLRNCCSHWSIACWAPPQSLNPVKGIREPGLDSTQAVICLPETESIISDSIAAPPVPIPVVILAVGTAAKTMLVLRKSVIATRTLPIPAPDLKSVV